MVSSSNAPGLKTVRACNSCVRRRARWYCAADDAFLCQNCDASVHSANPVARRHDRVRLQQTSSKQEEKVDLWPTWHHACKRKARTPRQSKYKRFMSVSTSSLVPELEPASGEEEEGLLYSVPVLDDNTNSEAVVECCSSKSNGECIAGFMASDKELEEFEADMESLLGRGRDGYDTFSIEELGMLDDNKYCTVVTGEVNEEIENELSKEDYDDGDDDEKIYEETDLCGVTLDVNFDSRVMDEGHEGRSKKIGLRLNYEVVSVEWCGSNGDEASPWMNGERPQFGTDDCWIDDMEMWGGGGEMHLGTVHQTNMYGINSHSFDEGREARVNRYREKRRTRLFSKKIRYEVRKLNAEKRPRMKGRFVKRSSLSHNSL